MPGRARRHQDRTAPGTARLHAAQPLPVAGQPADHGQRQDRPPGPASTPGRTMPGTTRRATLRHPGELQVALSWQEVLGHTDFGLDDSFFEVGGHSPLAAALVRELSRRFGNRAYIHDIYRTPSVRQLAASLARRAGGAAGAGQRTGPGAATGRAPARRRGFQPPHGHRPIAGATAHPAHRRQRADGRPPARRAAGQPRGRPALSGPCAKRRPCPRTPAPGRPAAPHRTRRDGLATGQPTPPTSQNQVSDYRRKPIASWPAASTRSSIPPAR